MPPPEMFSTQTHQEEQEAHQVSEAIAVGLGLETDADAELKSLSGNGVEVRLRVGFVSRDTSVPIAEIAEVSGAERKTRGRQSPQVRSGAGGGSR